MEYAILFILSLLFIIYNRLLRRDPDDYAEKAAISQPKTVKKVEKISTKQQELKKDSEKVIPHEPKEVKPKRKLRLEDIPVVKNPKDALLNSFKDGKDMKNVHIYNDGKIILASDVIYE